MKMKITKCKGEGQGSCKRCNDKGRWNMNWMCFLYEIDGMEGCYCSNCVKEIQRDTTEYPVLKSALELDIEYGLNTIEEAMLNVKLHANQIFNINEIHDRLEQLNNESEEIFCRTNFNADSKCDDLLAWINITDDGINTEDLNI